MSVDCAFKCIEMVYDKQHCSNCSVSGIADPLNSEKGTFGWFAQVKWLNLNGTRFHNECKGMYSGNFLQFQSFLTVCNQAFALIFPPIKFIAGCLSNQTEVNAYVRPTHLDEIFNCTRKTLANGTNCTETTRQLFESMVSKKTIERWCINALNETVSEKSFASICFQWNPNFECVAVVQVEWFDRHCSNSRANEWPIVDWGCIWFKFIISRNHIGITVNWAWRRCNGYNTDYDNWIDKSIDIWTDFNDIRIDRTHVVNGKAKEKSWTTSLYCVGGYYFDDRWLSFGDFNCICGYFALLPRLSKAQHKSHFFNNICFWFPILMLLFYRKIFLSPISF